MSQDRNFSPEQKIQGIFNLKSVHDRENFTLIKYGLNSFLTGVNQAVAGMKQLEAAQSSAFDETMLLGEHWLDVYIPADFEIITKDKEVITIPPATWLVSQLVTRRPDDKMERIVITNTGLTCFAAFDRRHISNETIEDELVVAQTDGIFDQPCNVLEIEIDAYSFIDKLFNSSAIRNVTLSGSFPVIE